MPIDLPIKPPRPAPVALDDRVFNKELSQLFPRFHNSETGHLLRLHTPHPENYLKGGALKDVRHSLKQEGYL